MTAVTSLLKTDPELISSIKSSCVLRSCSLDHCLACGPVMPITAWHFQIEGHPSLFHISFLILYKSFPLPTTKRTISIFVGNTLKEELFDLTTIFQPFSVKCMQRLAVLVFFYWLVSDFPLKLCLVSLKSPLHCHIEMGIVFTGVFFSVLVRDTLLTKWYAH